MPTILHRLHAWASTNPDDVAQRFRHDGRWVSITVREFRDRIHYLAAFLESRGHGRDGTSVILSYNCPHWVHFDLAALMAGVRSAGIYPNASPGDIRYVLEHTGAAVLAVQNLEYFGKIAGESRASPLPAAIRLVVVFEGDTSVIPGAVAYAEGLAEGKGLVESGRAPGFEEYLGRLDPKVGAILIYTSGTTGNPKGALLSHDNLVFASDAVTEAWRPPFGRGLLFSFLPLCHIAEMVQNVGMGISRRYTVSFCSKLENVSKELVEVEPTLLLAVPRLWEKLMEGVVGGIARSSGLRKGLAEWALAIGGRVAAAEYSGRRPGPLDRVQLPLARVLVLSKIKRTLGLRRAEIVASGAAALPAHVARWYRALGLEILENFGQTETTGVLCMTQPGVDSAGTVGKPIPGIEFRLAEDGEILTRGRHVFVGYFKDPAATAAALTADGWLHTGDLAEIDSRGLVRISGRKKEVLKTSGGKMVAPLPIEERLRASPLIGHACLVGDGRKFLSALLTLSESAMAERRNLLAEPVAGETIEHPPTLALVQQLVEEVNRPLPQYARIKRFSILAREFSIAEGEMTPTFKMRRNVIERRFRHVIDAMYSGSGG